MIHLRTKSTRIFAVMLLPMFALTAIVNAQTANNKPVESAKTSPTVVIVGDSIQLSYARVVTEQLKKKARVISPSANGGDSNSVLKNLDKWVLSHQPDVVHFNCGIHDTKRFKETEQFQVSPKQYEANLRKIVSLIRQKTNATVVFATTTPILHARAAKLRSGRDYELLNSCVEQYNKIATRVMKELKVR
jgi:lysophospholipase L1-like esterase